MALKDFSDAFTDAARRLEEASRYLAVDELRARRPQLETEMGRPDLWDDAEMARKVQTELAAVTDDLDTYDGLCRRIEDAETLWPAGPGGGRRFRRPRDRGGA